MSEDKKNVGKKLDEEDLDKVTGGAAKEGNTRPVRDPEESVAGLKQPIGPIRPVRPNEEDK